MKNYCNVCSEYFLGKDAVPTIDVKHFVHKMDRGMIYPVYCDGCDLRKVERDLETGKIILSISPNNLSYYCVEYAEWEKGKFINKENQ